jgi:adenylate kinase
MRKCRKFDGQFLEKKLPKRAVFPFDSLLWNILKEIETFDAVSMAIPIRIGLYGIPGSGKTTHLHSLETTIGKDVLYYEGSNLIANMSKDGLSGFKSLSDIQKHECRERAIKSIGNQPLVIMTCHCMFYEDGKFISVVTDADKSFFTHVIYLDYNSNDMMQWRKNDNQRTRPYISYNEVNLIIKIRLKLGNHLRNWELEDI